ncbi:hypothetical protein J5U46_24005 [Micromonospora tulbaghiae]|uniref:Rho termination factor, N-terminal domain n=1 Tax=Micromonospora tulbaghiae TaxID=479978 RepID=A0AAW4JN81_9ACTN|nr:hypothetical protein [Micromonospora tulbaghiae]
MAQRNSSGRGTTATRTKRQTGNQTPNTPGVSESAISRMKVDDIRSQLRRRGVSGISALRKPELVKTLARSMRGEGGAARRSTGPAGRPSATRKSTAAKKTTAAKRTTSARRSATSPAKTAPAARATGARAKATGTRKAAPARAKATSARAKAAPSRAKATSSRATTARAKAAPSRAKATSSRATATRSKAAPSRAKATSARAKAAPGRATAASSRAKAAPARAKAAPSRAKAAPSRAKAAPARAKAAPARKAPTAQTAPTRGPASSRSIGSSQLITSLADRPERPGRSLVTRDHEVIQRWARARGAKPATIAGTEREGRPGVLTFNIPGYRESSRIREITWDDWFRTFDLRRLNLIYQEQMRDGRQSNFFRTENPNREDG